MITAAGHKYLRGDIVVCNLQGDYGKPRPAVIVQADLFNSTHASISVCPVTSEIVDAPLFRLTLQPNNVNNLKHPSQIMIDKITAIKTDKIAQIIGRLSRDEQSRVKEALKLWLELDY